MINLYKVHWTLSRSVPLIDRPFEYVWAYNENEALSKLSNHLNNPCVTLNKPILIENPLSPNTKLTY